MQSNINQVLVDAISKHDPVKVQRCLQNGADSNYTWTHGLDSNLDLLSLQPTTPLCLVIFRISDCMLTKEDLSQFYDITKILLDNNADPEPAIRLAIQWYGEYQESKEPSLFNRNYHLIYEANSKID